MATQMLMTRKDSGFTLIELMIVVAIIGILASLAISAYQTYTIRAQISEGLQMAAGAKAPVIDAYNMIGAPPADRLEAGMSANAADTSGNYVSGINIVDGRVDVTFGNDVHADAFGDTVSLTPYLTQSGGIVWRCGSAPVPPNSVLLTGGGVTSAHQAPTVANRYLPSTCRS